MPLYQYKCPECGAIEDKFNCIDNHKNGPICCGKPMHQWFGSINIISDFQPYIDEHISKDGKPVLVQSKQHRKKLMKENDVYEAYGKGWI